MWYPSASFVIMVVVVSFIAEAVHAHNREAWDWVHGLPNCWQKCLNSSGCDSKSCICESSQESEYLSSAVDCAVQSCRSAGLNVALSFLAPLQMYCKATQDDIPDEILSSAYGCATATATSATWSTTRKAEHSTREPKTSKAPSNGLESTITSTVTLTTTNGDGNTLQVLIPIVMGASTMATGAMITSTLDSKQTTNPAATWSAGGVGSSGTLPSQTKDAPASPATAKATNIGNGSPFDVSVQGGSVQWDISAALVGVGILLAALVKL